MGAGRSTDNPRQRAEGPSGPVFARSAKADATLSEQPLGHQLMPMGNGGRQALRVCGSGYGYYSPIPAGGDTCERPITHIQANLPGSSGTARSSAPVHSGYSRMVHVANVGSVYRRDGSGRGSDRSLPGVQALWGMRGRAFKSASMGIYPLPRCFFLLVAFLTSGAMGLSGRVWGSGNHSSSSGLSPSCVGSKKSIAS